MKPKASKSKNAANSAKSSVGKRPVPPSLEAHTFKPGQSGNPSGRPKKKPLTELYDRLLADPKLVPVIEDSVRKMITSGRMVGMLQLKEMAERVEGKVTQPVDVELNLSLSERIAKFRERRSTDQ